MQYYKEQETQAPAVKPAKKKSKSTKDKKIIVGKLIISATPANKRNLIFVWNHLCKARDLTDSTHLIEETETYKNMKEYDKIYAKQLNQNEYTFKIESERDFKLLALDVRIAVSRLVDIYREELKYGMLGLFKNYSESELNLLNNAIKIYNYTLSKDITAIYEYYQYTPGTGVLTKNQIAIDWSDNNLIYDYCSILDSTEQALTEAGIYE